MVKSLSMISIVLLYFVLIPYSYAETKNVYKPRECNVSGYVIDKDTKGLNVRAGPSQQTKIISRIPYNDYNHFTSLHITEARDGWLKINGWDDWTVKAQFGEGMGWVYGGLVSTSVKGYETGWVYAYTQPNKDSETEGKFIGSHPESVNRVSILNCQNGWIFGKGISLEGEEIWGWLAPEDQCPNTLANCP